MEITHESESDAKLTVADAVAITHLSADTIRRYSNSGKLPTYRTPANHRRFTESDIRALVTRQDPPVDSVTPNTGSMGASSARRAS